MKYKCTASNPGFLLDILANSGTTAFTDLLKSAWKAGLFYFKHFPPFHARTCGKNTYSKFGSQQHT